MANGDVHARYAVGANMLLIPLGVASAFVWPPLSGIVFGALTGTAASPDLDHHQLTTYDERRMWRIWRPLGFCWQVYWYPYGLAHTHRGSSHTWPFGTLIRFIYLLWPMLTLSAVYIYEIDDTLAIEIVVWWLCAFCTHSIQDWIHYRLDSLPIWGSNKHNEGKRKRSKKRWR